MNMTSDLKRSLLILVTVTFVTAWFSELFYFPDEHYQVLEFMSHKLGSTPASALPWEFTARIRPWTQPLIYYAIARPLLWLGVSDLFTITWILRLLTGLFSLAALAAFARALLPTLPGEEERRAFLRYLPLFGFLPYLFVRTSSETFSAASFAFGLALAMGPRTVARLALVGLLCGLAFECRYQTALMALGLFAWLTVIARVRINLLAAFVAGGIVALALGTLADRWGYGAWVFPPWGYFSVNILQGVAAKTFGREPFFAYLYLLPATGFFAITLVVMGGMILMWLRNPRHPVSWVSLPFVALHVAVAHKEARFLFPLAILATSFPVLGFSPLLPRGRRCFARIWQWRHSWAAKATTALSLVFMVYLAVYPFGVRPHMPMARYLYRHDTGVVVSLAPPFESYPMYWTAAYQPRQLSGPQLAALLDKGSVLLMSETPVPPPSVKASLLYSEFPLARFGYGAAGASFIRSYTNFAGRVRFLKLLPLHWYTLYRLERSATMRS
jgi:phosphatidylinositol glycan class B